MKIVQLVIAASMLCGGAAFSQVTANVDSVNSARSTIRSSARDGFTRYNTETLFTQNGITEKVKREVVLRNGLRVSPDGSVVLPDGTKTTLRNNQILTLDGALEDTPISQSGTASVPLGGRPAAGARPDVGLSGRDGITGNNDAAFITRNGVKQQVSSEVRLESGIRIQANGTITLANGDRINLKPGQLLSFDGVLQEFPKSVTKP